VEWNDVRVLLALLRARNLHDAGARIGLNPSTVSRRLAALEEKLGERLFTRTRDGLRPTATAEGLRHHAEAMEAEVAALLQSVRATGARAEGVVRVATTEALGRMLVSEGLLSLRKEHPDLEIELLAGNQEVDLVRGDADVAVRLSPLKQPQLRARCVAKMGVGLFAATAYVRARGTARTAAALRGHDVLLPTGELHRLPEARWLAARPGIRVVFRSNSMPALVAAAAAAQGVVPLPLGWGDSEPALERLFAIDSVPARKIWLVSHEAQSTRPAVRIVTDHLAAILGRLFAPVRKT
jgi:DNA-binding transcriptional LysR family regulator